MHIQDLNVAAVPKGTKDATWLDVASRPDGGAWQLPFLCVKGRTDGPTLLVIAGVHGDEYEGVETIPEIYSQIDPQNLSGTLAMVPVSNPPAFGGCDRSSPIDGLNLARVFPGDPDGSISNRIAYWITDRLIAAAHYMIDLHSGGVTYDIPTLAGYTHSDSDLAQTSLAMARAFGAPILWGHPPPLPPGRSLSAATDLGVASIYAEAPGGGTVRPCDLACYREGVLSVMRSLDMLDGNPLERSPDHHFVGSGNLDQVISAPSAGYFQPEVALLDEVAAGQRLGIIRNLLGEPIDEIVADLNGVVIMVRRLRQVAVGDGLFHTTQRFA
jgi:predicted deacylase